MGGSTVSHSQCVEAPARAPERRTAKAVVSPYLGVMGAENTGVIGAAHHDLVWVFLGGVGGTGAIRAVRLGAMALPRHSLAGGIPHDGPAAPVREREWQCVCAHGLQQQGEKQTCCFPMLFDRGD